ncbi:hypothetical protein [Nostoc sp. CALU 1950]|uniref:hypothetical protein n=1 Tax=Nostoc sp. CALU 1950 TaxID=3104321 RepID=UPI003EC0A572
MYTVTYIVAIFGVAYLRDDFVSFVGWASCHWCQLNVKASPEQAFRYCLVPSLRLGMPVFEAPPQDLRQSRNEQHFQPEAGNEI